MALILTLLLMVLMTLKCQRKNMTSFLRNLNTKLKLKNNKDLKMNLNLLRLEKEVGLKAQVMIRVVRRNTTRMMIFSLKRMRTRVQVMAAIKLFRKRPRNQL